MSNGLTGYYDVVVEVEVGAVNRLLATVHQNSASEDASPKFIHSRVARVGSKPALSQFELAETFLQEYFAIGSIDSADISQSILTEVQHNVAAAQAAVRKLGRDLSQAVASPAPSGTAAEALGNILAAVSVVRGTAAIQVSTPALTLAAGSTSEVTVHAQVRAHYMPDPGTADLPKPIHGEIRATFSAKYNASGATGKPALEVKPSDDDNEIVFIPAAGTLTAAETKQIAHQIRRFLRTKFEPMSAELPDEFPFREFKNMVAGNTQAIALPLKLSGQLPALALNSVDNLFLAPGDAFALAISKAFIGAKLEPALNQIEQFSYTYKVTDDVFGSTVVAFHAWASNASLEWQSGAIMLTVTGGAHRWGWAVSDEDYNITIKQKLSLTLDVASQTVSLQAVGDPSITGLPQEYENKAKPKIIDMREDAVTSAQGLIAGELTKPRTTFNTAIKRFDGSANAKYTVLEITPDGVILRGSLTASQRPDVVVDFGETAAGNALTAFKSWVPAGTVENYSWSWVTQDSDQVILPWSGTLHVVNTPHRFIFHAPVPLGNVKQRRLDLQQVCLQVGGTQVGWASGTQSVSGGTTCKVGQPDWLATMPGWWVDLMLPIWGPDPGPDEMLSNGIVAHINAQPEALAQMGVQSAAPAQMSAQPAADAAAAAVTPAIIHFANDPSAAPLPVLGEALLASRLREAEVPVIVVMPQGAFDQTRAAVERRLGAFPPGLRTSIVLTEDYQGSWSKAFNAPTGPATYLMDATGEIAWRDAGPLQARALADALDRYGSIGRRGRGRLLRLSARPGEPAPDVPPLRRLCGQRALLMFWKSWSRPCLAELQRLQRLHEGPDGQGRVILALGDGENAERVQEIARRYGLRFTLVPDPKSELAKRFRVHCWPTTVWIDEQGLVQRAHFGATPDDRASGRDRS
jgi:peroxiredoxin